MREDVGGALEAAEKLKTIRKNHGLSQSDAAYRIGVSLRTYQRKEAGKSAITERDTRSMFSGTSNSGERLTTLEVIVNHDRLFVLESELTNGEVVTTLMGVDSTFDESSVNFYAPLSGESLGLWVDAGIAFTKPKNLEPNKLADDFAELYWPDVCLLIDVIGRSEEYA